MTPNRVKQRLEKGKPAVRMCLAIGDPIVAETLAARGWDWLVVDTEHNPIYHLSAGARAARAIIKTA